MATCWGSGMMSRWVRGPGLLLWVPIGSHWLLWIPATCIGGEGWSRGVVCPWLWSSPYGTAIATTTLATTTLATTTLAAATTLATTALATTALATATLAAAALATDTLAAAALAASTLATTSTSHPLVLGCLGSVNTSLGRLLAPGTSTTIPSLLLLLLLLLLPVLLLIPAGLVLMPEAVRMMAAALAMVVDILAAKAGAARREMEWMGAMGARSTIWILGMMAEATAMLLVLAVAMVTRVRMGAAAM